MAPKCKSSDAGNLDKALPLNEKVNIGKKKFYAEVTKICGKNESSTHEIA